MRGIFFLLFAACAAEDAPLVDELLDDDAAFDALVDDALGPPPRAMAVESFAGRVAPGVFLSGDAVRGEAPVVGGRPSIARARCIWAFQLDAVPPVTVGPPGAVWAFNVRYTPTGDLLPTVTGVPSACGPDVFPAGPGVAFTEELAFDGVTGTILRNTPAGWVPFSGPAAGAPTSPEWRAVLRTWP